MNNKLYNGWEFTNIYGEKLIPSLGYFKNDIEGYNIIDAFETNEEFYGCEICNKIEDEDTYKEETVQCIYIPEHPLNNLPGIWEDGDLIFGINHAFINLKLKLCNQCSYRIKISLTKSDHIAKGTTYNELIKEVRSILLSPLWGRFKKSKIKENDTMLITKLLLNQNNQVGLFGKLNNDIMRMIASNMREISCVKAARKIWNIWKKTTNICEDCNKRRFKNNMMFVRCSAKINSLYKKNVCKERCLFNCEYCGDFIILERCKLEDMEYIGERYQFCYNCSEDTYINYKWFGMSGEEYASRLDW